MAEKIEVFQDMNLRGPAIKRAELRDALIAGAVDPWRADLERSAEIARSAVIPGDVLLFRCKAGDSFPEAGLTLWQTKDGYYVPNIVPLESGQLTITQYNKILADFVERIAMPVANKFGYSVALTDPWQGLEDWLSPDAATNLRRFSRTANKSTGASHPSDKRRWLDFLIATHRAGDKLDASRLARWLHEAEKWDENSAHELAIDFERSLDLLSYYDEH